MNKSADRDDGDGLEGKLLVLDEQRASARRRREHFVMELISQDRLRRRDVGVGSSRARANLHEGEPVFTRRYTLSRWASPGVELRDKKLLEKHPEEKTEEPVLVGRRHTTGLDQSSLNYLRSICCPEEASSIRIGNRQDSRLSSKEGTQEASVIAEFDIDFPSTNAKAPSQGPELMTHRSLIFRAPPVILTERPSCNLAANPDAAASAFLASPFIDTEAECLFTRSSSNLLASTSAHSSTLASTSVNKAFEQGFSPALCPLPQQKPMTKIKMQHCDDKHRHSTMPPAEERRRSKNTRRSYRNRSAESMPLGSTTKINTRHGSTLASVSMDAGPLRDPSPAAGQATPARRIPGSGCRLPPEVTYFDWPEEVDSVHSRVPGGVTWDTQLESYFAAASANRLAGRGHRSKEASPDESTDGSATDASLTEFYGAVAEMEGRLKLGSQHSQSHFTSRTRKCSTSSTSGASAAFDEGASTSTSSTSIPPQPLVLTERQLSITPLLLKEWIEICPIANAAQLTLARRSRLPVIFSDNAPSEGCTSSASECDRCDMNASCVNRAQETLPFPSEPLPPSPLKHDASTANATTRNLGSSDWGTSEACTSSPSEQEDSVRMQKQTKLRVQPTRFGPGSAHQSRVLGAPGLGEMGVLNAAQMILARKMQHSPNKSASCMYSDYVASEGCTTSSASECEASFRGRHFLGGKV